MLPFWFKRRGVKRIKNIAVRRRRKSSGTSSTSTPDATHAGAPVLLQIHGGGWVIGNKDQQAMPLMYHLAAPAGCAWRSTTGSPPWHVARPPRRLKRALAWVKEHIAEYGGDPDYVVVTGGRPAGTSPR